MDLAQLLPAPAEVVINLPDGTPTDIVFKMVGQDSKQFRDIAKKMARSMLGKEQKPDIDALEQQNAELIASCVVGWKGLTEDGQPLDYTPAKALDLLNRPELSFIREQLEVCVAKRTNFFRRGSAQSAGEDTTAHST